MREFRNPFKVISQVFAGQGKEIGRGTQALLKGVNDGGATTKDGDGPVKKAKKTRGISSQRSTLLTAGNVAGQETRGRTLLGGAG